MTEEEATGWKPVPPHSGLNLRPLRNLRILFFLRRGPIQLMPDLHMLDAADEARAQALDRPGQIGMLQALRQLPEDDLELEPREVGAQAEMLADAECDMRI